MNGVLFLCVANSARSQMAEGIAKYLAPNLKIWSAGSKPSQVRTEAIQVLKEIGIDISNHRSKNVAEIPPHEVDTVITLCQEEECPLFLGDANRISWAMPDPASSEKPLEAFRKARDEIYERTKTLLLIK